MKKIIETNYKGIKIFTIDYLQNGNISDIHLDDLIYKKSLMYSLLYFEFKLNNLNINIEDIINICKNNENWFDNYKWENNEIKKEFIEIITNIYYNIYRYSKDKCKSMALFWVTLYGFKSF